MSEGSIPSPEHRAVNEATAEKLVAGEAKKHGWSQWKEVKKYLLPGHRLFRSSCPGYKQAEGDKSQRLTQAAVDWLTNNHINSIISFNSFSYTQSEKDLLAQAHIQYHHYSTPDFNSPSIQNLKAATDFHEKLQGAVTLVHCGYGHGRTGTGISAIQLYAEDGKRPTEREWIQDNYVEVMAKNEVENLQKLAEEYREHPRPHPDVNE